MFNALELIKSYIPDIKKNSAQALVFIIKIAGACLAILFNAAVSRNLPIADAGAFFAAYSFVTILYAFGRIGFGYATSKFVALYLSRDECDKALGVSIISVVSVLLFSSMIAICIIIFQRNMITFGIFDAKVAKIIPLFVWGIPIFCTMSMILEVMKGMRRPFSFAISDSIIVKISALVFVYTGAVLYGLEGAVVGYTVSLAFSLIASSAMIVSLNRKDGMLVKPHFYFRGIFSSIPYFAVLSIGTVCGQWIAPIIVSKYLSNEASALYFTAYRTSSVIEFVLISSAAVIAPNFIRIHTQYGFERLSNAAKKVSLTTFIAAGVISLPMVICSDYIMGLYGNDFSSGSNVLRILAMFQWIAAPAGVYLYVLIATGNERLIAMVTVISSLIGFIMVFALTSYYGLIGAAVGQGSFMIIQNLTLLVFALRGSQR
ncbi:oligosaccharide flippase family protein [Sphingobium yanoikuyae]|uniref:oligosaccharide flippase family protein n=1 Tax=Sphingobium yanoikuyae TaxID=13690 RepID=UPI0009BD45CA|nr:oligosaccharide flippase family protein [Sphingobium yanoikuyae]